MKINVTMEGTPEELEKVMDALLNEGVEQSAEIDFEKLNYVDEDIDEKPPKVKEVADIVGEHLEDLAKSIEKQSFEEFDNRTDVTGHFKAEYNQGFCDGFDWAVEVLKREVGK